MPFDVIAATVGPLLSALTDEAHLLLLNGALVLALLLAVTPLNIYGF